MPDNDLPYSRSLAPLESLRAGVKRPGGFCVPGALPRPMSLVQLGAAFAAEDAPRKLAWLLAHQYSRAELGFAAIKGVDAAVAAVERRPQAVEG